MTAAIYRVFVIALVTIAPLTWVASDKTAAATDVPLCAATSLTLRVESDDGRFAGTSHDGTIALIRNVGTAACELSALPKLSMLDSNRVVIAAGEPPSARFMHPGPVVMPIELAPGELAATKLR